MEVFHDDGTALFNLEGEFLVRCPRCQGRAVVHPPAGGRPPRFVCPGCGLARTEVGQFVAQAGPADRHFGLPLWLQAPCAGHTLWANNLAHLSFIERLVSAGLRLRHRPVGTPYVNRRLAARLPRWMLSAKHRAAVLHAVAGLREAALS